jgi:hypothetical protein
MLLVVMIEQVDAPGSEDAGRPALLYTCIRAGDRSWIPSSRIDAHPYRRHSLGRPGRAFIRVDLSNGSGVG